MNTSPYLLALVGTAVLVLNACGKRPDVKSQLADLETAFSTAGASNAAAGPGPSEVVTVVNAALSAARQNDYAVGVIALQSFAHLPRVTPEQLRVVHEAMQTLTADLVERAGKGDAKAQEDLAAIERTRSQ